MFGNKDRAIEDLAANEASQSKVTRHISNQNPSCCPCTRRRLHHLLSDLEQSRRRQRISGKSGQTHGDGKEGRVRGCRGSKVFKVRVGTQELAERCVRYRVVEDRFSKAFLCEGYLTARDEKRGREATSKLHKLGLSNIVFHQLDVLNPVSIHLLAKFIHARFGRLDILVNNAGATGALLDEKVLKSLNIDSKTWLSGKAVNQIQGAIKYTYEKAEECLNTNYYGVKRLTEALLPLLQLSTVGARIVNVSSLRSELKRIPSEEIRNELGGVGC